MGKTIRVALRGEGVSPTLVKEPRDGRIDLGHVVEGGGAASEVRNGSASVASGGSRRFHNSKQEVLTVVVLLVLCCELVLRNTSVFPLAFALAPIDDAHENFDHRASFTCVPSEATIEPGKACRVRVRFEVGS